MSRDRNPPLPSISRLLAHTTRIIAMLMAISACLFALYLVIEILEGDSLPAMITIRAAGTAILALCTAGWIWARRRQRQFLAAIAGLTFTTTISICTTLATYYSRETFDIALGYGLVIAVLNVVLWRSMRSLLPGLVGALAPPLILMLSQHPTSDQLVDYLSLTGVTIVLTIAVFVIQQAVLDEIISLHQELVAEAGTDDLTGLMNRRRWSVLVTDWERTNAERPYCVLYLDLDRFKELNDGKGHDVGDRVLIAFARMLDVTIPADAYAARFGGDEFVIFLPGAMQRAQQLAARIREQIRLEAEGLHGLAVSIGIAEAIKGSDRSDVLREADRAMLFGKAQAYGALPRT
ncbi:MAG: GGDEF domain-containing protein [Thermomicrobiales bacterium]